MSRRRAVLSLTVTTLVLAATALASCGSGGSQESNTSTNFTPSMVFMREDSDGFWQTWVANKDLSDQVKLTSESADSGWAVWKPGGRQTSLRVQSHRSRSRRHECHQRHLHDEPRRLGDRQADPLR